MNVLDLLSLKGKVALVTGASRGLGLQMAEGLGEAGASVVITARRAADLEEAQRHLEASGISAMALLGDIASPEDIQRWMAEIQRVHGRLDVLVNNAGTTWAAPAEEMPLADFEKVMRVNVNGTFAVSQAVARTFFIPQQDGRVVNIASVAGLIGSDPRYMRTVGYNTSKGAVVNLTRALATEWAPYNIRVNCICPGFFPTKMTSRTLERAEERIRERAPLHRLGGPDDLKGMCLLFASDASGYMTGQVVAVDGGATVW